MDAQADLPLLGTQIILLVLSRGASFYDEIQAPIKQSGKNSFFSENTPQSLYNTIVGVQANFRVSYPIRVISRVKCIGYIGKGVLNSNLGSNPDPCCIQNRVITNRVIKRLRCTFFLKHPNDIYTYAL